MTLGELLDLMEDDYEGVTMTWDEWIRELLELVD